MREVIKVAFPVLVCSIILAAPALTVWWDDDGGVPVCTETADQYRPDIIADGANGAIISWYDARGTNNDIYAQRIDAFGNVLWTLNGVVVCPATGSQFNPQLISDGYNGAIITWYDNRDGNYDIYVQRVDCAGTTIWHLPDGYPVCTATGDQLAPIIVPDGMGNAIITWVDDRSGNTDIYSQRISISGNSMWTYDGVPICTVAGSQYEQTLISDGAGGAIITWSDERGGYTDIYAQRIDASGNLQWTSGGVPVCTASRNQYSPQIISDGSGGAIITWYDYRSGSHYDIYAQRINLSGTVQWTTDGVAVCTAASSQAYPQLTWDGCGGAIISWCDYRGENGDIYAQRIDTSGVVKWATGGLEVCTAISLQAYPQIIWDGYSGAIISWYDYRGVNADIYAQRIDTSGVVMWEADGEAVCTAIENQEVCRLTTDGFNGAIISWQDFRNGNWDVYTQQVGPDGNVPSFPPAIHSVEDIPGDQGGYINLAWDASRIDYLIGDVTEYTIWRALEVQQAQSLLADGTVTLSSPSEAAADELLKAAENRILRQGIFSGEPYYWMLVSTQTAYRLEHYSMIVETAFDSTSVCQDQHYFQVIAHTDDPSVFWTSAVDSGYSVDNLAPCMPTSFAGVQSYDPAGLQLSWSPNTESDLDCYHIYRGATEGFEPGPDSFVDSVCDTALFDADWSWSGTYYYKLAAVDLHGNESGYVVLAPDDITDTDTPDLPKMNFLSQNYPNPFNPSTTIEFGLESPAQVRVAVYDAAGRRVSTLLNGFKQAGSYSVSWDGTDAGGRAVASGVYFYSIRAGSFEQRKKMVLLR